MDILILSIVTQMMPLLPPGCCQQAAEVTPSTVYLPDRRWEEGPKYLVLAPGP